MSKTIPVIYKDTVFLFPLGAPVTVGMSINIASIDAISEVNMVSAADTGYGAPEICKLASFIFKC